MQVVLAAILNFVLLVQFVPAEASSPKSKAQRVLQAFQSTEKDLASQLLSLEDDLEKELEEIDEAYKNEELSIEKSSLVLLNAKDGEFMPQIKTSQKIIDEALVAMELAGQVEIIQELRAPRGFSQHMGAESYLACPKFTATIPVKAITYVKSPCAEQNQNSYPRPAKISNWDPTGSMIFGENWMPGDKTSLYIGHADKNYRGHLTAIDVMIAAGEIRPLNLSEYSRVSGILKTEPINLEALQSRYQRERTAVLSAKSELSAVNSANRENLIDEAEARFETQKDKLAQLSEINKLAVVASIRASKNPEQMERAFSTAFKFEYNRKMLELVVEEEWTGEWNFRSVNTITKVLALLDQSDSIASKYSYAKAASFNSAVGSAFTRSLEFRNMLKVVTLKYQKVTGTRIVITA